MINEQNYIKISLENGLYNAGIVGLVKFIKFLDFADYKLDGQDLYLHKDFFDENLADNYLNFIYEKYGHFSKYYRLDEFDYENADEKGLKGFDNIFKGKTQITVCNIYNEIGFDNLAKEYIKISSKNTDEKKESLKYLVEYLKNNQDLKKWLVIADVTRTNFVHFFNKFGYLSCSQGNYLIKTNNNISFADELKEFIFAQLNDFIVNIDNYDNNKFRCIQCSNYGAKTKKDMLSLEFIQGAVVDPGRKKSQFWNNEFDLMICPICYFVYMMMPFGFFQIKKGFYFDDVFINNNYEIESLCSINKSVEFSIKANSEIKNGKMQLLNAIVEEELKLKASYEIDNIELILKESDKKRLFYTYNIIGKEMLEIIDKSRDYLSKLSNISIKINEEYYQPFPDVVNNIFTYSNQWLVINKLCRVEECKSYIIKYILDIQIIQNNIKKENGMEKVDSKISSARMSGINLKNSIGTDAENKLRGYVYKLLGALSTGDKDMFLNTMLRMYGGMNKEVPNVMINLFMDDESFKEIGYAYLLGLKSENYEKKGE